MAAAECFESLERYILDPDTEAILARCEMKEEVVGRMVSQREDLLTNILDGVMHFVFHLQSQSMAKDRVLMLHTMVQEHLLKADDLQVFTQLKSIRKMQELISNVARKNIHSSEKLHQLLMSSTELQYDPDHQEKVEMLQMGLTVLQRDFNKQII